jgi:ribosomal protein S18 acetylase RimI-like enzyme
MINIEKLTENNLEKLDDVANLFDQYRIFYSQQSSPSAARDFLLERIKNKESEIFFASQNDVVLGFVQLYYSFSSVGMKKIIILNDLYIAAKARKQGVAKALIAKVKDFCLENKITKVTLSTQKNNQAAQCLYVLEGFVNDDNFLTYGLEITL